MVELLAGPLVGAAVADKLEEKNWGNLVVAIDPGLLGEPDEIKRRVQVRPRMGLCSPFPRERLARDSKVSG